MIVIYLGMWCVHDLLPSLDGSYLLYTCSLCIWFYSDRETCFSCPFWNPMIEGTLLLIRIIGSLFMVVWTLNPTFVAIQFLNPTPICAATPLSTHILVFYPRSFVYLLIHLSSSYPSKVRLFLIVVRAFEIIRICQFPIPERRSLSVSSLLEQLWHVNPIIHSAPSHPCNALPDGTI